MEKVQASDNSEDFMALFNGQWEGRFGSQSEADMSLCCSLAFWSGKNPEQMDRLFRQSKLYRDKWDVVHDAAGLTYGQKTIQAAIDCTEDTYSPAGPIFVTVYFQQIIAVFIPKQSDCKLFTLKCRTYAVNIHGIPPDINWPAFKISLCKFSHQHLGITTQTAIQTHSSVGFLPDGHRYARSDRIAAGKGSGNPYEEVL